jgi:hypothetical protein
VIFFTEGGACQERKLCTSGWAGSEWVAFMSDLDDRLAKFQVPAPEQAEVVAIVESTRQDIVVTA